MYMYLHIVDLKIYNQKGYLWSWHRITINKEFFELLKVYERLLTNWIWYYCWFLLK